MQILFRTILDVLLLPAIIRTFLLKIVQGSLNDTRRDKTKFLDLIKSNDVGIILAGIDDLIGSIDDILKPLGIPTPTIKDENFHGINDGLLELNPDNLSITIMLTILTATLSKKNQLKNRKIFFFKCYDKIKILDSQRVEKLLLGLNCPCEGKYCTDPDCDHPD